MSSFSLDKDTAKAVANAYKSGAFKIVPETFLERDEARRKRNQADYRRRKALRELEAKKASQ